MGKKVTWICSLLLFLGLSSVASDEILKCRKEMKNDQAFACYVDEAVREEGEIISEPSDNEISTLDFIRNKNTKYLPDNVTTIFPNLQSFFAYECSIQEIHKTNFVGLSKLKNLYLFYNQLENLEGNVFSDLISLESLKLHTNVINHIDRNAFHGLGKLEGLYLSNNNLDKLDHKMFASLSSLRRLNLDNNVINRIDRNAFQGLDKLERLFLENNKLDKLDHEMFASLSSLRILHLYTNAINHIDRNAFHGLGKLEELHLENNKLDKLDHKMFASLSSLESLNLDNNVINHIDGDAFPELSKLELLDLKDNKLDKLDHEMFASLSSLKYFNLNNNAINHIDKNTFHGLGKLERLFISNNMLDKLDHEMFASLSSLIYLHLDNNAIIHIERNAFHGLGELEGLYLSNNKLDTLNHEVFSSLSSLRILNLDNNAITHMVRYVFHGLENLNKLHLSNNKLESLDYDLLQPLSSLKELHLGITVNISFSIFMSKFYFFTANNSLIHIDEIIFKKFKILFPKLRVLDLSSNPCINLKTSTFYYGEINETEIEQIIPTVSSKCQKKIETKDDHLNQCNINQINEGIRKHLSDFQKENNEQLLKFKEEIVYRLCIRPILTYECPTFANSANSHPGKLQVMQNKMLRMVLNARFRTRISFLHEKNNISKIKEFIYILTEKFYIKNAESENSVVKKLGNYNPDTFRTYKLIKPLGT
ncbi:CLUMA_CG005125, isoform A [Clunio marinus]|uniref:CLUMA_CG005125, isoform A n=1 Tax=Clunio marinus TaxID=568069 RepID=A0A1J1HTQ7_9DIPT|nr:CLUMA_CG005125, isoform A [Clunio marinus]